MSSTKRHQPQESAEVERLQGLVRRLVEAYEDERAMPSPRGDALIRAARAALNAETDDAS